MVAQVDGVFGDRKGKVGQCGEATERWQESGCGGGSLRAESGSAARRPRGGGVELRRWKPEGKVGQCGEAAERWRRRVAVASLIR